MVHSMTGTDPDALDAARYRLLRSDLDVLTDLGFVNAAALDKWLDDEIAYKGNAGTNVSNASVLGG